MEVQRPTFAWNASKREGRLLQIIQEEAPRLQDSIMVDGSSYTTTLTGSIYPKRATANTAAGFSILNYDGTGASNGSINHFLTAAPELYIWKRLNTASAWSVAGKDVLIITKDIWN